MRPSCDTSRRDHLHHTNSSAPMEIFEMREFLDLETSSLLLVENYKGASDEVQRLIQIAKSNILDGRKVLFPCCVCRKQFSKLENLRIHLNKHFRILKFSCKYCDKSFLDPSNLSVHTQYHFDSEKKFECSYCPKKFAKKAYLNRHLFTHDKNLCRFMCSICEFRTATSPELKYHKRIHLKKPIGCDQCEQTFYSESDLNKHRKTHSGMKDYTCEICFEEFSRYGNLQRHLKVHSSLKFRCKYCGAYYANAVSCNKHIKQHTGEKANLNGKKLLDDVVSSPTPNFFQWL